MTENNTMRKSLRDRAKEFATQLPLMNGREKGETKEIMSQICTIVDYGFLAGDNGDYAVIVVKERPGKFYFGGTVLSDQLHQLDADGYRDDILSDGLPFVMSEKRSKNNRTYTNVEFFPE